MAPLPASATDAALVVLGHTAAGTAITADGVAFTVTVCDPVAVQPLPEVTATDTVTAPLGPAVNVIDRVPAPEVMAPFVIDHA